MQPLKESEYVQEVRKLFALANPKAPGLADILAIVGAFAIEDRLANEFVISVESLIRAIILVGLRSNRPFAAPHWVAQALEIPAELLPNLESDFQNKDAFIQSSYLRGSCKFVLSTTVKTRIIPRSLDLALATTQRLVFDARHLVFALLEQPSQKWTALGYQNLTDSSQLARIRQNLITKIEESHEADENMEAWRAALKQSPSQTSDRSNQLDDRLSAQRDEPALADLLGRAEFAKDVVGWLMSVNKEFNSQKDNDGQAFVIHLDGPWGAGKSSVLNFIESDLRGMNERWIVINFNAWREQKNLPAWWSLIFQFAIHTPMQLNFIQRLRFNCVWLWWQFRNHWAGWLMAVAGMIFLGWLYLFSGIGNGVGKSVGNISMKDAFSLITGIGVLVGASRVILFGSSASAKALEELRSDPYGPVMAMFRSLVAAAHKPILIIIDDLDRCSADYVVTLLENIQTMLRGVPVCYLIAGDRRWITTSFECRYTDFNKALNEPGRPMGYLFLEKMFQISVSLPTVSNYQLESYWLGLLAGDMKIKSQGQTKPDLIKDAENKVRGKYQQEELLDLIKGAESEEQAAALRLAAARNLASPQGDAERNSRYAKLVGIVEANPRAMKRLINAIALKQAAHIRAGGTTNLDAIARWTILELRWPTLAQFIQINPSILTGEVCEDPTLSSLLKQENVRVLMEGPAGLYGLNPAALAHII